jgi:hypothetical protein
LQALLQDCDQALVAVADLQGRILMCNAGFVEAGLASCPSLAELVDGELWPVLMSAVQAGGRWSGSLRLANGQSFSASLRRVLPGAPASLVLVARPAAE